MADQLPAMSKIAATRVLQWNVDLDRGLRSAKSGGQCEALMKLGPQLVRWSHDPMVTSTTSNMFKLEPGQERVFANSILLRLADTFRSANNFTRLCILKILLLEFKERKWTKEGFATNDGVKAPHAKGASNLRFSDMRRRRLTDDGLLTRKRIANHVEMLRRVKSVLDSGDPTARALALRVIGCLADLGKDSSDLHSLVLQSLHSSHKQEVSAAFFAAGCLSELSEEFAVHCLDGAVKMVNAIETPPQVKVWAILCFAKLGPTPALALEAHEAGRNLMLKLPTSEIITTMLISLTLLSLNSIVVIRRQVDLVLVYLSSDPRINVRVMGLKCLYKLSLRAISCAYISEEGICQVLAVAEDLEIPLAVHVLALQILRKVLRHKLATMDFQSLLHIISRIELVALRGDWVVVLQSLYLLVDIALALVLTTSRNGLWHESSKALQMDEITFSTRVCLLLCDQMYLAGGVALDVGRIREPSTNDGEEFGSTISGRGDIRGLSFEKISAISMLLVKLVQACPQLVSIVVDCLAVVIEAVGKAVLEQTNNRTTVEVTPSQMEVDGEGSQDKDISEKECRNVGEVPDKKEEHSGPHNTILSVLGRCLCSCISALPYQTKNIKVIHSRLHQIGVDLMALNSCEYFLGPVLGALMKATLMHSSILTIVDTHGRRNSKMDEANNSSGTVGESSRQQIHESKEMLHILASGIATKGKFWLAYKVGREAALCNIWETAEFVFRTLLDKIQSEGCYFWLNALHCLACAECSLNFKRDDSGNVGEDNKPGSANDYSDSKFSAYEDINLHIFGMAATTAIPFYKSSIDNLSAGVSLERTFEFQQWVLTLRLELVECASQLGGIVTSITCFDTDAGVIDLEHEGKNDDLNSALRAGSEKIELLAIRLKKLTESYDCMCSSFMGIDEASLGIISRAALFCSLLMFCSVGIFSPQATSFGPTLSVGSAALDLFQRVHKADGGDWDDLLLFSIQSGAGFVTGGTSVFTCKHQDLALMNLCKWAVRATLELQNQLSLIGLVRGARLLESIIQECLHLPWLLPPFFFCTRPRTCVKLFLTQALAGEGEELSVVQGSAFALSFCLQVVHVPVDGQFAPKKLFCALSFQPADSPSQAEVRLSHFNRLGSRKDESFSQTLMEKLILHRQALGSRSVDLHTAVSNCGNCETPCSFFSLSVNDNGQGFASCTLDTSQAPRGQYYLSLSTLCQDIKGREWMISLFGSNPLFKVVPTS